MSTRIIARMADRNVDPCDCGLTPQVKEIKTVTYIAVCPCGNHGPAMHVRDWAISEWNRQLSDCDQAGGRAMNDKPEAASAVKIR